MSGWKPGFFMATLAGVGILVALAQALQPGGILSPASETGEPSPMRFDRIVYGLAAFVFFVGMYMTFFGGAGMLPWMPGLRGMEQKGREAARTATPFSMNEFRRLSRDAQLEFLEGYREEQELQKTLMKHADYLEAERAAFAERRPSLGRKRGGYRNINEAI